MLSIMRRLEIGTRGAEVRFLQRMLNLRLDNAEVREDGTYSPQTHLAFLRWQESQEEGKAGRPGVVDEEAFRALGMKSSVLQWFEPFEREAGTSCWTAGLMMLLRQRHERRLGEERNRMGMIWRLGETERNIQVFAGQHRLNILSRGEKGAGVERMQWLEWLRKEPLLAIGVAELGSNRWAHCCLIEGFYSDENMDASGTVLRIHDPSLAKNERNYGAALSGSGVGMPHRRFDWDGVYLLGRLST
jgi:hypothetical protein